MRTLATTTIAVLSLCWSTAIDHAQIQAPLAGAMLEHVGMAVRDIDASALVYSQIFGAPVSKPTIVTTDAPGGKATFKTAQLRTANFRIDLAQPVGTNVLSSWLDKYGDGVQHVGLTVPDTLPSRVKSLQSLGGTITMGQADGPFAFIDMTSLVGTTLELTVRRAAPAPAPTLPPSGLTLASNPASHIGLVVPDVEAAARAFATMLDVPLPRFNVVPNPAFPPSFAGDPKTSVKTITFKLGDVSMEFQQSSPGKNPWNDFGRLHGGAGVEYVAFRLGDNLTPMRRQLERFGGREAIGNAESGYSQYDLLSKLGLMIEILGTPKN